MLTADGWPEVGPEETWLLEVMAAAEEVARTRCDTVVTDAHLGLALARETGPAAELLREVEADPIAWRDVMVSFMAYGESVGLGPSDAPARWYRWRAEQDGEPVEALSLWVEADAATRVRLAIQDAAQDGTPVGPAHLLVSLRKGVGYGGGCFPSHVTIKDLRVAAGLTHHPRVYAEGHGPGAARLPNKRTPLVLLGGGTDDLAVYTAIGKIASTSRGRAVADLRVAAVFAAYPDPVQRDYSLGVLTGIGAGQVIDSGLDFRADAKDPAVVARLAEADVIYFDGGHPADLYDALWATPAYEAIVDAVDGGAVVVGSSGGTNVLGLGDGLGRYEEKPEQLLGWLHALVFPHLRDSTLQNLRTEHRRFPRHPCLGVPHRGAVLVLPGWEDFRTLWPGDHGQPGVYVAEPGAEPVSLPSVAVDEL